MKSSGITLGELQSRENFWLALPTDGRDAVDFGLPRSARRSESSESAFVSPLADEPRLTTPSRICSQLTLSGGLLEDPEEQPDGGRIRGKVGQTSTETNGGCPREDPGGSVIHANSTRRHEPQERKCC